MPVDTVANVYDVIGADGITRLTAAFYHLVSSTISCAPCTLKPISVGRKPACGIF